jgi:hypothetical protein
MVTRVAADEAERLGLRYALEAQFLIVEANLAVRLRVFEDGAPLFDRPVEARARQRIPIATPRKELRITLERPGAAGAPGSSIREEVNTEVERAVYVVATPGAISLTVTIP